MDYQFESQPFNHDPFSPSPDFIHAGSSHIYSTEPVLEAVNLTESYDGVIFPTNVLLHSARPPPVVLPTPLASENSMDSGIGGFDDAGGLINRGSSEEKDAGLTPAQNRRKAQNRAAQRAFRERKERHVKELAAKLSELESSAHTLQSDNERLKLALQRAKIENDILRSTGTTSSVGSPYDPNASPSTDPYSVGAPSSSAGSSVRATKMLTANAAWDFVMAHPLVADGHVSVADVFERLRGLTTCDGQGPSFEEADVRRVVEESRRGTGNELL